MFNSTRSPQEEQPIEWKPVPEFEGAYFVSSDGCVMRRGGPKPLSLLKDGDRRFFEMWKDGKRHRISQYRLMLSVFPERAHEFKKELKYRTKSEVSIPDLTGEEWRPVPGFEGRFAVSNQGRVKRMQGVKRWRAGDLLKGYVSQNGYHYVAIQHKGERRRAYIHRLVAEAFLGINPSLDVNHKNGIKTDNRLENLEYTTRSENILHAIHKLGVQIGRHGEENRLSKLKEEHVRMIRDLYASEKYSAASIAEAFGVSMTNIFAIVTRRSWAFLE